MLIEPLLKNQICENSELSEMLASFDNKPAFFLKKIPHVIDPEDLYPCVIYDIDKREDSSLDVIGTLFLNVHFSDENNCFDNESAVMLNNLEQKLIDVINGTFYTPGLQETSVCAIWNHSEAFESKSYSTTESDEPVIKTLGIKIFFDLMSFPIQTTTEPDPIQAINEWTKSTFHCVNVITYDTLSDVWKPTNDFPAIYWRLNSISLSDGQSHNTALFNCKIIGHIIAKNITGRVSWLKKLAEGLEISGELPFTDESNFNIKSVMIEPGADQLLKGQITIEGSYGVIRTLPEGQLLMHAHFN